jgi:hypothetical protein
MSAYSFVSAVSGPIVFFLDFLYVFTYSLAVDAKVTLQVDRAVWLKFRAACIERSVVAGRILENFMSAQLEKWAKETK